MNAINWEDAPIWATALGENLGSYAWVCDEGYCFMGIHNPPCHPYRGYSREDFTIVERRAILAEWTGKELPPAGTICEFSRFPDANEVKWQVVHVLANLSDVRLIEPVAIFVPVEGPAQSDQAVFSCFRPIRTAEQIAAEQREAALKQMQIDSRCFANRMIFEDLYDAGYRKQVEK